MSNKQQPTGALYELDDYIDAHKPADGGRVAFIDALAKQFGMARENLYRLARVGKGVIFKDGERISLLERKGDTKK